MQATRRGYQVVDRLAGASGLARWQAAAKRWAALHSSLLLLERTGTQLDGVLRGDVNSLDLVFPDGSSSIVEQVYEDSPGFRVYNGMLQQVFAALVARLPAERCLRVLEIGGGTGSASSFILPTLPAERTEYVFTDLSPQFLALGEQKLREFACVRYTVLDLEKDPREQGFEPHSFDVILGADVVHATTDIRRALQGIRSLLAPEGLLVLMEPVRRQAAFDMTFGVLRGWWHFTDTDLRADSPLLSRERWRAVLEETGYREVAVLSDPVPNEESVHAIFLARPPKRRRARKARRLRQPRSVAPQHS